MNEKKEVDNRCKFVQPSYLKKKTEEIWKNNIKFTKSKWTKYILLQPVCFSAVYPINVDSSRVAVSNVFEYLFFLSSN